MTIKPRVRFAGGQKLVSIEDLDPATPAARRTLAFRDQLLRERGGADRLSALRIAMIDTAAALTAMIESELVKKLSGQEIDLSALNSLINSRRREAELIGIDPAPLDISLDAYLEKK